MVKKGKTKPLDSNK